MDDTRFLFRVESAFALESRGLFFLLGRPDEEDRVIRAGMTAGPTDREPRFREPIHAVEIADSVSERKSWFGLGLRYLDSTQLGWWRGIDWPGMELTISATPILYPCPCCGSRSLAEEERGSYDICIMCGWEDCPVQLRDPGYRGGLNGESLNEARDRFFAAHPHLRREKHG